MRFEDLQIGDVFAIDGAPYEAYHVGERIVLAYALEHHIRLIWCWNADGAPEPEREIEDYERIHAPDDLAGDQYVKDAFSDLRFNRNNLTDFERQCDEDLKNLL